MSTYEKCINGMTYRWDSEMWVSAYDMGGHQLKCLELPAPPATKFETAWRHFGDTRSDEVGRSASRC